MTELRTSQRPETEGHDGVGVIRGGAPTGLGAHGLPYFLGVSAKTTGAEGLSMNLLIVPPGAKAPAHTHRGFETAGYQISGRARSRWGKRLEHAIETDAGDFFYIAAGVPHTVENLSATEPCTVIIARNQAAEEEPTDLYEPS